MQKFLSSADNPTKRNISHNWQSSHFSAWTFALKPRNLSLQMAKHFHQTQPPAHKLLAVFRDISQVVHPQGYKDISHHASEPCAKASHTPNTSLSFARFAQLSLTSTTLSTCVVLIHTMFLHVYVHSLQYLHKQHSRHKL